MTALTADLLLVEGDEDDGVLEATAGLDQGPGGLQDGGHAGAVVVEAVGEGCGVPVSPDHQDLVLGTVELGAGVDPDQVESLGDLLAGLPELGMRDCDDRKQVWTRPSP